MGAGLGQGGRPAPMLRIETLVFALLRFAQKPLPMFARAFVLTRLINPSTQFRNQSIAVFFLQTE
jgi:hypothetical protein